MTRADDALSCSVRSRLVRVLLSLITIAAIAPSAFAAPCSNPDGVEGEIVYNTTYKVAQFCNGTHWIGMGLNSDTGPDSDTLASLGCTTGQIPKWSGFTWACADDNAAGVPAGSVAGTVQFRGPSAVFAADDANLVWDDTNKRLGIGTVTPASPLYIKGAIGAQAVPSIGPYPMRRYSDLASWAANSTGATGTLKIALPTSWTSTMMAIRIVGYHYSTGTGAWDILISGYNFTGGSWNGVAVDVRGRAPVPIRLGHDGSRNVILLGQTDSNWNLAWPAPVKRLQVD